MTISASRLRPGQTRPRSAAGCATPVTRESPTATSPSVSWPCTAARSPVAPRPLRRSTRRPSPSPLRYAGRVKPRAPVVRRSPSVTSQLGFGERIFATAADRGLAANIDLGIEHVETALIAELVYANEIANERGFDVFDAEVNVGGQAPVGCG